MERLPQRNPHGHPFLAALDPLDVGKWIYVCVKIHQNAEKFTIDLMCAPDSAADIALHVAARFNEKHVVRKHLTNGKWNTPETGGPFPFKPGTICGILITVRQQGYDIQLNGATNLSMFKHRLPYDSVTNLCVSFDCDVIHAISGMEGMKPVPHHVLDKLTLGKFIIPFDYFSGHSVEIFGTPTKADGQFTFDLMREAGAQRVFFRLQPKLKEQVIVRNSELDGKWGDEEKSLCGGFPFAKGREFKLRITAEAQRYHVEINSDISIDFKKRLYDASHWLIVNGDLTLNKMVFY